MHRVGEKLIREGKQDKLWSNYCRVKPAYFGNITLYSPS